MRSYLRRHEAIGVVDRELSSAISDRADAAEDDGLARGSVQREGAPPGTAPGLVAQPVHYAQSSEACALRCLENPSCVFFELETVEPRCSLGFSALRFEPPALPIPGCMDSRAAGYNESAEISRSTRQLAQDLRSQEEVILNSHIMSRRGAL